MSGLASLTITARTVDCTIAPVRRNRSVFDVPRKSFARGVVTVMLPATANAEVNAKPPTSKFRIMFMGFPCERAKSHVPPMLDDIEPVKVGTSAQDGEKTPGFVRYPNWDLADHRKKMAVG